MSYYTYYEIECFDDGAKKDKEIILGNHYIDRQIMNCIMREISKKSNYEFTCGDYSIYSQGCIKWYYHDDDMIDISKQFPHVIFGVYGDGEERLDFWHNFYYNGRMLECEGEIVYPDEVYLSKFLKGG